MRRMTAMAAILALAATACVSARAGGAVEIGAIYPTNGGQGPGGIDEYRGVRLAADLANEDGGVGGRPIALRLETADSAEAAPGAVERLAGRGVDLILGSYGSTISKPAAEKATELGALFWETGAVGYLGMAAAAGESVFRFPPTGGHLGREAVAFSDEVLVPKIDPGRPLRYAVAYVDDVYGQAVGEGALAEIERRGLPLAGTFPYTLQGTNYRDLARRIGAARTDVLFVSAYLEDAVAMRNALTAEKVPLVASIGTSSSYCMKSFGVIMGAGAVGLFASDKPEGHVVRPDSLEANAAATLERARTEYKALYGEEMSGAALTGFSAAWALFRHVMPEAGATTPDAVADAARAADLPLGSLPNGSGLKFAPPGDADAGANLRATSVIWEWTAPETREVVWPPQFATGELVVHPIS